MSHAAPAAGTPPKKQNIQIVSNGVENLLSLSLSLCLMMTAFVQATYVVEEQTETWRFIWVSLESFLHRQWSSLGQQSMLWERTCVRRTSLAAFHSLLILGEGNIPLVLWACFTERTYILRTKYSSSLGTMRTDRYGNIMLILVLLLRFLFSSSCWALFRLKLPAYNAHLLTLYQHRAANN